MLKDESEVPELVVPAEVAKLLGSYVADVAEELVVMPPPFELVAEDAPVPVGPYNELELDET